MKSPTISKDESNILVAIGKLETQMDGLRVDMAGARIEIKEINTGITARILNLESNSVSKIEINPKLEEYETRITNLETAGASNRGQIKVWVIIGGGVWTISLIFISIFITTHFHL